MGWETQNKWIESKVSKVASVSWSDMKKHIFKTIAGLTPTSIALLILVQTLPATQGFERKTGAAVM